MNEALLQLDPKQVWTNFSALNAIPRASKKEERVIAFVKEFGEKLGLPTYVDEVGNVIIKKPASAGMENRIPVVLQSHLDMVHQKNAATDFNFDTDGIQMYIDGDWVKAKGTTLGADNGIGVASIMTLLASTDISHPPLEALFTIDEETGMTGALSLKGGLLEGAIMLNLDTEEDNELTIGCAGGVDVTANGNYTTQAPQGDTALGIRLKGLTGGHSGIDIHKGRGNANKLMNRLLNTLIKKIQLDIAGIEGGSLRNAIPRESSADVVILASQQEIFDQEIAKYQVILQKEYQSTDPNIQLSIETISKPDQVMNSAFVHTLLKTMYACPNGIYRMSPDIAGLVQTSNNIARVEVKEGKYSIQCLTRSSVDSEKTDLADAITSVFELLGATITFGGSYPGWMPNPHAKIVTLMSNLYKEMFHEEALVSACHAGLECGILGTNYPDIEMISFGPNIHGAHSPDEKVQISSVQKYWSYLLETLKRIPEAV
ncbi:MAG: aminoacyl-histidine dipeptidase [Chitinophagaceae bacterium]|nr:aminoacyl-histidine dipeptidase [Chitinophagaceae bacterium]